MSSTAVEGRREWKNMVKDCEIGGRVNQDRKKLEQRMKGGELKWSEGKEREIDCKRKGWN